VASPRTQPQEGRAPASCSASHAGTPVRRGREAGRGREERDSPSHRATNAAPAAAPAGGSLWAAKRGATVDRVALRSILIADDEEPIRHVLTVLLSEHGYFVRAVKDGEEAMRELSARDYDALVTDVRMPRVDGCSSFAPCRK